MLFSNDLIATIASFEYHLNKYKIKIYKFALVFRKADDQVRSISVRLELSNQ
jgi:hypothetical protein